MFPAYPGFENPPLRVEVQWRGAARPVVARLEQWPDSDKAVLVCSFEDDEEDGEWIILEPHGDVPHFVKRSNGTQEKWARYVRLAFERISMTAGRLFFWPELSGPQIALANLSKRSFWLNGWQDVNQVGPKRSCFNIGFKTGDMSANEAKRLIIQAAKTKGSDAHFAHCWAQRSADEKRSQLTGYGGDLTELNTLMYCILRKSTDWRIRPGTHWDWRMSFEPDLRLRLRNTSTGRYEFGIEALQPWEELLQAHFVPRLHTEWIDKHPCARDFLRKEWCIVGKAEVHGDPTFHEQLEAKLQLRDWLQDKATPAEIEQLLVT